MEKGRVLTETMDGVGLLTFVGTDPHNALSPKMCREFAEALDRLEEDEGVRVLVLTGAGHVAFATDPDGADEEADTGAEADPACNMCERLARFSKPVVARIRGDCRGAGLAMVLAADIRIAAQDLDFALTAERAAALGIERAFVRVVGASQARYLLLTGERIEASEALRIGLVHRVVPDADLSDSVADLARLLVERDPEVLRGAKQALAQLTPADRHEPQQPRRE